jgi:hypothetical protein
MPKFDQLPPKIQEAWVAFAAKVAVGGTAKEGYQEYGNVVAWKNFEGKPIPQFNEPPMTETITNAWHAATKEVNDLVGRMP